MQEAPADDQEKDLGLKRAQVSRPIAKPEGAYRHGDLKNALIVAARAAVRQRGGADFTVREIAILAGVRHAAFYRHYPSKEALLSEIVRQECEVLVGRIESAEAKSAGAAVFEAVAFAYVEFSMERPGEYWMLSQLRECSKDSQDLIRKALVAPIEKIRASGALLSDADAESLATLLWGQLHGLAMLAHGGFLAPEALKAMLETLGRLWVAKKV